MQLYSRNRSRQRAIALTAVVVLVCCQIAAVVHATNFAVAGIALDQTTGDMAQVVGCDGLPDENGDGGSDCPTEHATADSGKLPLLAPLPAALPFAPARRSQTFLASRHQFEWPQGRAPPRTRLCSWLI